MPVPTSQPSRANAVRHLHHNITHASFMNHRNDGQLSPQIRQLILDKGLERTFKDYMRLASERSKRSKAVSSCGFCADTKDIYKALGDPILNSEALILQDPMHLDSSLSEQAITEQVVEAEEDKVYFEKVAQGLERIATVQPRRSNGQTYLKDRVVKSTSRVHSVKFGISYLEICDQLDKQIQATVERSKSPQPSIRLDVFNTTKQAYYGGLLEKALNGRGRSALNASASKHNAGNAEQASDYHPHVEEAWSPRPTSPKSSDRKGQLSTTTPHTPIKYSTPRLPLALSQSHSLLSQQQFVTAPNNVTASIKSMEMILGLARERLVPDPIERLLHARDLINFEKDKITESLIEDMERQDAERHVMAVRKLRAFEINKNSTFESDMRKMREKASTRMAAAKDLSEHPGLSQCDPSSTRLQRSPLKASASKHDKLVVIPK
ncbi:hypothetical protein SeMB42_g04539 [Synchytrium endobioticum]|uniref:Uncharacterized protein n=1 Tax=Synchytrium endobioticum TaxID=286115 RepID=A0A507CXE5_9FUNG|nr:hypothetical protein SeMB42_g04539 [Synchytrium endobioticum]